MHRAYIYICSNSYRGLGKNVPDEDASEVVCLLRTEKQTKTKSNLRRKQKLNAQVFCLYWAALTCLRE